MNIYFEESLPDGAVDYSLLLLHGQDQCCDMWTRGGVLDSLASHGHRAVAIDLPGKKFTQLFLARFFNLFWF